MRAKTLCLAISALGDARQRSADRPLFHGAALGALEQHVRRRLSWADRATGNFLSTFDHSNSLNRQVHTVLPIHLEAIGRDRPDSTLEVELLQGRQPNVAGSCAREQLQFDRELRGGPEAGLVKVRQ